MLNLADQLISSWQDLLVDELDKPYMQELALFLDQQYQQATIYPPKELIFNALNTTPLEGVKVVILGQDPYHGPNQAHGLCFSVQNDVKVPPSLVNIYKELQRDLGLDMPSQGNLQSWAEQGVLLLNATLTVEQAKAGSHQGKGWETFTDKIIQLVNERCEGVVFMLWGSYAQKKGQMIDRQRHLVLESVHPSPLSAHRGFIGNGHFSMANAYLKDHNQSAIDWSVPEIQQSLF
jgi:uracil-DNA glycosylase